MNKVTLLKGDCLQKLKELKDNSVDSVVTDPPYEIGFMGKGWDDSGIANNPELWKEVLRVLKPGGHLLSFSHSRTYHRQAVAVEDAGFEIRDQIMWVYGSGFPKSHNIGKSVDKLLGNEREVVGTTNNIKLKSGQMYEGWQSADRIDLDITKGTSPYEGWGTALKPAHEPIVMARKPFKGSVAQNVLEWGTGGINIDGCRVGYTDNDDPRIGKGYEWESKAEPFGEGKTTQKKEGWNTEGRFPANIMFECTCENPIVKENDKEPYEYKDNEYEVEGFIKGVKPNSPSNYNDTKGGVIHTDPNCPCRILDEQSGNRKGWSSQNHNTFNPYGGNALHSTDTERNGFHKGYDDTGGASRFFYCPKASKKDRNDGIEGNIHPTVKPTDLMAYLVRMVTPKGGTVLDPFMGSGSTGKASVREGMDFIGIEREDEYIEIAKTRIEHEKGKHNYRQFFDI